MFCSVELHEIKIDLDVQLYPGQECSVQRDKNGIQRNCTNRAQRICTTIQNTVNVFMYERMRTASAANHYI